ncbi:MAG: ATP-binding cassette domain-containing protein [Gemmatimonadaceae bacterium]
MNDATTAAVRTSGLTCRFGALLAVDHVDLVIRPGAIFGLLGPNGAGKSTTIKMLTTLLPPTSGAAVVAGFDVATQASQVRRHIGYVPQLLSADGQLTGYDNLLLSARLYDVTSRERRERIDDALTFMGLETAAHSLVRTYSGGMIRRLELAQAMLHHPAVLFLDEPTIGLDPIARHAVWERLKESRLRFSMTVLLTTHDMEEADLLCDELAIMHAGRIAAQGTPAALKAQAGPHATLDDVFIHVAGSTLVEGGTYRDTRSTRRTATRLGG